MPAELAGVAALRRFFDGLIAPPAGRPDLCSERVIDRFLHGRLQAFVAGHGVGLAHRQRGHAVRVHVRKRFGFAGEISIGALNADQELQPALNILCVVALHMRVACAKECQQRQASDGAIGLRAGPVTILTQHGRFMSRAKLVGIPTAVGALIDRQPPQRRLHCRFRFRRAAALPGDGHAIGRHAIGINLRHAARGDRRGGTFDNGA